MYKKSDSHFSIIKLNLILQFLTSHYYLVKFKGEVNSTIAFTELLYSNFLAMIKKHNSELPATFYNKTLLQ